MSNLLLTRNDDWRLNSSFFQNYDWISIARYGAVGSFVLSPGTLQESSSLKLPSLHSFFKKVFSSLVLYAWYRWLDGRFPARTGIVIAKKVLLDSAVLGMPLYSSFYLGERHFYRPELGEVTLGTS